MKIVDSMWDILLFLDSHFTEKSPANQKDDSDLDILNLMFKIIIVESAKVL